MKKSIKSIVAVLFIILISVAIIVWPLIIIFKSGIPIVVGALLIFISLFLFYKFGFDKIKSFAIHVSVYCLVAQFFWGLTTAILEKNLLIVSWIMVLLLTTLLIFYSFKDKPNQINKFYIIKNSILFAICFGVLPLTLYFTSFYILTNDYMYERYFVNADKVQAVISNSTNFEQLDENIFDFTSIRSFSTSVYDNKSQFLDYCSANENIMHDCQENGINPSNIYDFFVSKKNVYEKFDMNFIVFGFSTGVLLFCVYQNYVNKNRTQVLIFGIFIVLLMYFSTYSDGAIIYWILKYIKLPNQSYSIKAEDIYSIQEMLKGISVVFGVFIALDRVYKIDDKCKKTETLLRSNQNEI